MKILFFGDIVGRVGRNGIKKQLKAIVKKHQPDIIIANAENLAHGTGVTPKTIHEMQEAGIDYFTSGNHIWNKPIGEELLQEKKPKVLRPANYENKSGTGVLEIEHNGNKLLLINLQGQVFMNEEVSNPFHKIDEILKKKPLIKYDAIFVDFHAEATSEKKALGWFLDGRVSAVVGTHTHIPTADAQILPKGTAYITDVGMTGPERSVLGVEIEPVLGRFLEENKKGFSYAEEGTCQINAVVIETGKNKLAQSIEFIQFTTET